MHKLCSSCEKTFKRFCFINEHLRMLVFDQPCQHILLFSSISQLCDPYFVYLLFSYKIAIFEEIPSRMPLIILDT